MENRFGIKDLLLFVLVIGVIVLVVLLMIQTDRQWEQVQLTRNMLQQQTTDLAQIRRLLEQGVPVAGGANSNSSAAASTADEAYEQRFRRVKQAQEMENYARGDWLVDTFGVVPDKLTPIISSDAYSSEVQSYVLEGLATRDPETLEWVPSLATDWTISEDGLTMDFNLRRGVTFSNGEPLTADDVIYSYQLIMNPQIEAPRMRAYYDKIKSVEKTGDYSVRFTFTEPYYNSFTLAAGLEILPQEFYSGFTPEQFNRSTGLLLGSGAYRLADPESWRPEPGKPIELVRNERYWGEPPPFDKLVWRVIENDTARMTTFRNGDIDVFGAQPEQFKSMLDDPKLLERTQHFEYQPITSGYAYIGWNQQRDGKPTAFADPRVRQAMTMLIDRNRIINDLYYGYGILATGPFSPLSPQTNPQVEPWPYDPSKAKTLLYEAGYADRDNDGVLEGPDGKPLRFKLTYNSQRDLTARMVLLVKDTLARAGVVVEPDPTEWSVLLDRLNQRNFDAVTLGWSGVLESDPYQIFHSSQIEETGDNFIQYRNPELDKLIEQGRQTVDEEKRMEIWRNVHRILHEDQPYTFLVNPKALLFMDNRIQNVQRVKMGLNPQYEWFVPEPRQKWTP